MGARLIIAGAWALAAVLTAMPALGALFRAYEGVYDRDRKAGLMRRVTKPQSKKMAGVLKQADEAMSWAINGNFDKVWPDAARRDRIVCGIVEALKATKLKVEQ